MPHSLSRPRVEAIISRILHIQDGGLNIKASLHEEASAALLKRGRSGETDLIEKALIYGFLQFLAYKKVAFLQRRFHDQACTAIRDTIVKYTKIKRSDMSTDAEYEASVDTIRCIEIFRDQLVMQMEATAITREDTKAKLMESKGLRGLSQQKAIAQHTRETGETKISQLSAQIVLKQKDHGHDFENGMREDEREYRAKAPENMLTVLIEETLEAEEAQAGIEDNLTTELAKMSLA